MIFANFFINRYDNNLSFVAIVKNEGPYIREWIEYHKLVGVDKFLFMIELRINHYFTKSESEYVKKKNRGMADQSTGVKRTMQDFYLHDRNEKYDFIMERYVNKLKTILKNEED